MKTQIASKVYFAVAHPYNNDDRLDPMPLYLGAGAEAEAQEERCFFGTDTQDRTWFCKEITELDPANQPTYAEQFFRMGYLARKLCVGEFGIMFHGNAEDQDDLREKLSAQE